MQSIRVARLSVLILILFGSLWSTAVGADMEFSGVIYSDFTYDTFDGENSFNVERVYVNVRGNLNREVKFRVTSDIDKPVPTGTGYRLILKYAYFSWTHNTIGTITAGMLGTNAFKVQEKTWGLRYLFKSALDQFNYAPSADIGLSYDRTLYRDLSISVQVTNGEGYKFAESNSGKRMHLRLLYGREELSAANSWNTGLYTSWEKLPNNRESYISAIFAGAYISPLTIGGEVAFRDREDVNYPDLEESLYSLYGRVKLASDMRIFGRTDYSWFHAPTRGDLQVTVDRVIRWYIVGGEYSGLTGVKIAPNILYYMNSESQNRVMLRLNFEFQW